MNSGKAAKLLSQTSNHGKSTNVFSFSYASGLLRFPILKHGTTIVFGRNLVLMINKLMLLYCVYQ